jgi:hypothetical protein
VRVAVIGTRDASHTARPPHGAAQQRADMRRTVGLSTRQVNGITERFSPPPTTETIQSP